MRLGHVWHRAREHEAKGLFIPYIHELGLIAWLPTYLARDMIYAEYSLHDLMTMICNDHLETCTKYSNESNR
jgi:hypothetical protein